MCNELMAIRAVYYVGQRRPRRPHMKASDLFGKAAVMDVALRLGEVLEMTRIPRSSWWRGVKEGRFPAPIKFGPKTTRWRRSDIQALIQTGVFTPARRNRREKKTD